MSNRVLPRTWDLVRERLEDVPLLARHFIEQFSVEPGKEVAGISDAAMRVLMSYDWPGNVRQLENAIERAIVITLRKTQGNVKEAAAENCARGEARAAILGHHGCGTTAGRGRAALDGRAP